MTSHLVIDARMARHSGIGRYIRELVPRVARLRPGWAITLLGDPAHAPGFTALADRARWVRCMAPIYSLREQWAVPRAIPDRDALLWVPHYDLPLAWRGRLAVTVHDVFHLVDPHSNAVRRMYARRMFRAVREGADAIICVSEFTRRELREWGGPSRVEPAVISNGVGAEWGEPSPLPRQHPRKYVLCVGSVKPHKNLRVVLDAWARLGGQHDEDLVIVGRTEGLHGADAGSLARAREAGEKVRLVGEVSDESLRAWVQGAEALVFPSTYEGFGLPPLEAMAAGVPCIASDIPAVREVCGDAAMYFDPSSGGALEHRILELLCGTRERDALVARGRERVARFSWDASAAATAQVLEQAMQAGGRFRR